MVLKKSYQKVYGVALKVQNQKRYGLIEVVSFIVETKAEHDGLYDEMLSISKQQLPMKIISQEQLDNFVFVFGKWACPQLYWWMKFLGSRESNPLLQLKHNNNS